MEENKELIEIPKGVSQEILKKIYKNVLAAVLIMIYFIILNLAYSNIKLERLIGDLQIFAGAFLIVGIVMLEKAYKKESGTHTITAIELFALSIHTLTIMHVISMFKYDFRLYLLTSSYLISIYFILKTVVIYTKERKGYLKNLSDIREITKKEEPIKKEASKKNIKQDKEDSKVKVEIIPSEKKENEVEEIKKDIKKKKTPTKKSNVKKEIKEIETKKETKVEEKNTTKKEPSKTKTKKTTSKEDKIKLEQKEEKPKEVKKTTKNKTKKEVK